MRRFWCHALTTATLAKEMAESCQYPHGEEAYLAGLLHDVGRLGLLAAVPDQYTPLFRLDDTDESLCSHELQQLGTTHAVVGAWLVDSWRLDGFIADSVRYHHEAAATLAHAHPLIRITHVASRLARVLYQDPIDREAILAAEQVAMDLCGLDAQYCRRIGNLARLQVHKAAGRLGVDISGICRYPGNELDPDATQLLPVWNDEAASRRALTEALQHMVLCHATRLRLNEPAALAAWSDGCGETDVLRTFAHTLHILFGLLCPGVFMREAGQCLLQGQPLQPSAGRFGELTLPLHATDSAVARALQTGRLTEISAGGGPLLDRQLLDVLDADKLLCLPLLEGDERLGVLILQTGKGALDALGVREPFLLALATQAAQGLLLARRCRESSRIEAHERHQAYRQHARVVAHEVNNPLSIIKNYLSLLAHRLVEAGAGNAEDIRRELDIIRIEINRVGHILSRLGEPVLAAASTGSGFDAVDLIEEVASFFEELVLSPQAGHGVVQLSTHADGQLLAVGADRAMVKQVLLNLTKNALEALRGQAGEISLEAHGPVNRNGQLFIELRVRDSGPGIAPILLGQLFKPVSSTKGPAHSGLGLAIVKELVECAAGYVSCRSNQHGTEFSVLLPTHPAARLQAVTEITEAQSIDNG
ncbi:hypothetical protein GCM10027296_42410 [Chitinimonas naiadis]